MARGETTLPLSWAWSEETLERPLGRRTFLKVCTLAAAAVGLPAAAGAQMAAAVARGKRPSVVWLSFQECTGCTESLLRATHPALDELILDLISLDYHEALLAPAGRSAEEARRQAMEEHRGEYVLVVEGAIPTADHGNYCKIGGRTALEIVTEAAADAALVIAIGSCAAFGGLPAAAPNPTRAVGVSQVLAGKRVVTIPGCPPNPYNFLGAVLQFATFGTLPALDALGRPLFAYARTIHDLCPRRSHFDAGRFAERFGDEEHRLGYCLYQLGCKGPQTHSSCPTRNFNDVVGAWPVGMGHPCIGCTEQALLWRVPLHQVAQIERPEPPDAFPPIVSDHGRVSAAGAAVAGAVGGAVVGAGFMASRKLSAPAAAESAPAGGGEGKEGSP